MVRLRRRRIKFRFKFIAFIAVLLLLFAFCESRLGSISENMVYDGAAKLFETTVNSEVESLLDEFQLLDTSYGTDGSVTSVSVRADEANRFKAELIKKLSKKLIGNNTIWVPIGNFVDVKLLNGVGFKVPVNINYTGTVAVEFFDDFSSAGVNQTKYSLNIEISAVLHTNSVTYNQEIELDTGYILAQTVIIGKVPEVSLSK